MQDSLPDAPLPPTIPLPGKFPPPLPALVVRADGYGGLLPLHPGLSPVPEGDKTLGMLCHLLGIFTGFLGPLILWLVKKDTSPFADHHGREALNFQLTVFLAFLALGSVTVVLMFLVVGILLVPFLFILQILAIVAEVMAAVAAQRGDWHRYPFCIRFF